MPVLGTGVNSLKPGEVGRVGVKVGEPDGSPCGTVCVGLNVVSGVFAAEGLPVGVVGLSVIDEGSELGGRFRICSALPGQCNCTCDGYVPGNE